jgi:hypothetical protein
LRTPYLGLLEGGEGVGAEASGSRRRGHGIAKVPAQDAHEAAEGGTLKSANGGADSDFHSSGLLPEPGVERIALNRAPDAGLQGVEALLQGRGEQGRRWR